MSLRFSIVDTGMGLDAAAREKLFKPFSQADGSMARRFGGSGLGLAICHRLIVAMGGDIRVESEAGRGACFTFTARFERAQQALPVAEAALGSLDDGSLSGRVLLAEDNPVNREIAASMLDLLGVPFDAVENGAQAVDRFTAGSYAAVLMDCQMPEMDGFEATRRIRLWEQQRSERAGVPARVPVIALTANAMAGDRERCLDAGMDDYLAKPFKRHQLKRVLACWLGGEARAETTGTVPALVARDPAGAVPVLDPRVLEGLRSLCRPGENDLVVRLAELYRVDAAQRLDEMRQAQADGDALALRKAAHAMKSASANVGATRLVELLLRVERAGRDGRIDLATGLIADVEAMLPTVLTALQAECERAAA